MSATQVNVRDPRNWILSPSKFPDYPPANARREMLRSVAGAAYLNEWWSFLAGLRPAPPKPPGLVRPSERWRMSQSSNEIAVLVGRRGKDPR
jgi:hypothetical protein